MSIASIRDDVEPANADGCGYRQCWFTGWERGDSHLYASKGNAMRKLLMVVIVIMMLTIEGGVVPECPPDESVNCVFGFGYGDHPVVEALP